MTLKIKNANFICSQMTQRDIKYAFEFECSVLDFIYKELIASGLVEKHERYYKPTYKLMKLAFGADKITLESHQIRKLVVNETFYISDLKELFGNQVLVDQAIESGWILQEKGRYRKSVKLEEWLAEGEDELLLEKNDE